jgi:hypothetical protein
VDEDNAAVFFGSFMFVVTNLVFWMFLAIGMDTFALYRAESKSAPHAYSDIVASFGALPSTTQEQMLRLQSAFRTSGRQPQLLEPKPNSPGGSCSERTLITALLAHGMHGPQVSIEQLAGWANTDKTRAQAVVDAAVRANTPSDADPSSLTIHIFEAALRSARIGWQALAFKRRASRAATLANLDESHMSEVQFHGDASYETAAAPTSPNHLLPTPTSPPPSVEALASQVIFMQSSLQEMQRQLSHRDTKADWPPT